MKDNARELFELLPAIHRIRDAQLAQTQGLERGPLEELMAVLSEQLDIAEESLAQCYDDLFIETCAPWVIPYIGDLIGYQPLLNTRAEADGSRADMANARAEVAHEIALRRRKGTALVLEQLARDVTHWDARAVEYFQRLCTHQYMNHVRPGNLQSPDLRKGAALEWIGTAFEPVSRNIDVRHIESRRGRHNIPNVGLHLWRLRGYPRRFAPATREAPRLYRFSPLGHDTALFNHPVAETDIAHLAEPDNVPMPLSRRRLAEHKDRHVGIRAQADAPVDNPSPAIRLWVDGVEIERHAIHVCHLGEHGGAWAHVPPPDDSYAIDPVSGRIALPDNADDPAEVRVTWHEGFSADIGGGEYERGESLPAVSEDVTVIRVNASDPIDGDVTDLPSAIALIDGDTLIEIRDNSRYTGPLDIQLAANASLEIRARNGYRPILAPDALTIGGDENSSCRLNGLLIIDSPLSVPAGRLLTKLELQHCTLVPGRALDTDGTALHPDEASLEVLAPGVAVEISASIVGAIRAHEHASVRLTDSIVDANSSQSMAYCAPADEAPGGMFSAIGSTVIGRIHATRFELVSNSILFAAAPETSPDAAPVRTERKQVGCVRFSWLPLASIVPARHQCQPTAADPDVRPRFTSTAFGTPPYCQLTGNTPASIRMGADDESEMGAFHHLYGPQRETNLGIRLAEYLRVGLRAGLFHES
ncbi:hypothetical protein [Nitrogeniibacter aestuarii]|uniref:hypothetical protein n=1 Tax=Nitrogeniibacter aestuarii TaxID=2815343 RepID=UPI001E3A3E2A|nr:hypothetical protein [Nitrogeniibacter aestuarii]